MHTTETRLTWTQTAHGMLDVYVAECGPYDFEIRSTRNSGFLLRMYRVRSEHSPRLVWERDGYGLEDAMERAERLADEHVPVITVWAIKTMAFFFGSFWLYEPTHPP